MASIQIIVGSMLGGTEYVAEACQETLESLGHQTALHLTPEFQNIAQKDQIWLICTSTHGAGEYPDNIQSFITDLIAEQDLIHIPFFIIGLGDSNYDTFCLAAENTKKTLISKGCNELITLKKFDMSQNIDPEELAQQWITDHKDHLS